MNIQKPATSSLRLLPARKGSAIGVRIMVQSDLAKHLKLLIWEAAAERDPHVLNHEVAAKIEMALGDVIQDTGLLRELHELNMLYNKGQRSRT